MKAIIIEDEALIAKELQDKLNMVATDVDVIEILPSLKTAKKWFMQNAEPDVLFVDVQLSDGVSFDLFDIYQITCPVIFTTAYDEYALRAFKVNGIDYLLKPVDKNELKKAVDRCRNLLENKKAASPDIHTLIQGIKQGNNSSLYKEKFIVNVRNNWIPVNTNNIACFMRDNLNYLYTFNNEKYILEYATLEDIEELLDPRKFYRANRQYIVHMDAIQSVKPQENSKLTITLRTPLKFEIDISREKAPLFKKWFDR
jgi:DNA-binding LytR/AlgR family response regulator